MSALDWSEYHVRFGTICRAERGGQVATIFQPAAGGDYRLSIEGNAEASAVQRLSTLKAAKAAAELALSPEVES